MQKICSLNDIVPETGVCALVDGLQIAVFRTRNNHLFALNNYDPFSHTNVLSRGIIGGHTEGEQEILYVASPIYKQRFNLATGQCLDDETVRIPCYAVTEQEGAVWVGGVL